MAEQALVTISVVVPCLDERGAVEGTVRGVAAALEAVPAAEIVAVDDGSTDGTGDILDRLAGGDLDGVLRVVRHRGNRGYGAAVKTGARRARGELVVLIDADGTYPADRIPDLVAAATDADMVVGARTAPGAQHPVARRPPKALLRAWVSWLVGERVPDTNSGLRLFRREALLRYAKVLPDGFSLTTTLTVAMMRSGESVEFLPVAYHRRVGRSKLRPVRDALTFLKVAVRTGLYFAPMRVLMPPAAVLGVAFAASLVRDVLVLRDLTDTSVLLLFLALQVGILAVLADMLRRSRP